MRQPEAHFPLLHASPLPHFLPLGSLDQAVVALAGAQTWQGFVGLAAPAA